MGLPPSRDLLQAVFFGMESPVTAPIYAVPSRGRCSYKQGQWRLGTSKQHPYETDVLVPFIVRGPGIAARSSVGALCANIDLMPTVLELAAGWTKADLQVAPLSSWPLLESPSAHCALGLHCALKAGRRHHRACRRRPTAIRCSSCCCPMRHS
jgi:hypothetical protein